MGIPFFFTPDSRMTGMNRIRFTQNTQNVHAFKKSYAAREGSPRTLEFGQNSSSLSVASCVFAKP